MRSAMSVAMALTQVRSGIGSSAVTIAFTTWHQRFGSAINRLRSAVFGVFWILSLSLRFSADLRGMRTFVYTRLLYDHTYSKKNINRVRLPVLHVGS